MKPLISVIVPVYKVELYLRQCVESVLNQSFSNFELILVDDGSPDMCPVICDEYAQKDQRIKVIHKKNGGLSDARNKGLDVAKGEYVMFLDSDDYWDTDDALFKLSISIKNAVPDIILFGCKDYYVKSNRLIISRMGYDPNFLRNHTMDENVKYLFESNLFPGSAWLLAVKRSILMDRKIYFVNGIKAEDYDWLINLFLQIKDIDAVNEPFYVYRKGRVGSITTTSDLDSIHSLMYTIDKWYPILKGTNTIRNQYLLNLLVFMYLISLVVYSSLSKEQKVIAYQLISERSFIVNCARTRKMKILSFIHKIIGIRFMCFLFKVIR